MRFWPRKKISLALQGGGSHGAFSWGVLDRLLEERGIEFEGITATSAGAMNAACLAHGLSTGGRDTARETLSVFWKRVADQMPLEGSAVNLLGTDGEQLSANGELSPTWKAFLRLTRALSPYQWNPFDINPLRDIVNETFDFARIRQCNQIKLFIAATEVRTGKLRLFANEEMTADALLASACLPSLNQAIIIDDRAYWDGGFVANPAISPLFYQCRGADIVIVLLNPLQRPELPNTQEEIAHRVAELSFNSAFLREMRAIAYVKQHLAGSRLVLGRLERRLRRLRFHMIEGDDLMVQLPHESRMNIHHTFLEMLRDQGRQRADRWLRDSRRHLGKRSSIDLAALFM